MVASFDVFLSHNSKDKPAVRELAEALRDRGLRVWLDEWELVPGRPWLDSLEEIIQSVRCAAVLVGRDGLGPWEEAEMRGLLSEFVRRKLPVIPVLLPDAPHEPSLPLFLKQFTWVDLRDGLIAGRLDQIQWGITGEKPQPARQKGSSPDLSENAVFANYRDWAAEHDRAREAAVLASPGQVFTEPLTDIRFLWISGGRFQMGGNRNDCERPPHWVKISPFWLAETPVTNRQYAVFLGQKLRAKEPAYWRDRRFSSLNQPVVGVSWEDAQAFCQWLARVSGRQIMLPSEAQWEFAARGTDGREYPWGNQLPDKTRACFDFDIQSGQPEPVGSYPAGVGPFGTLDQSGNVWEWCQDAWDEKAYAKRAQRGEELADPLAETQGALRRALRGGGCFTPAGYLRAACRHWYPAEKRDVNIGFRIAAHTAK